MKKFFVVAVLSLLLLGALYAADKQFWANKPYEQWSTEECRKMMTESPWAKTLTQRQATMRQQSRSFGRTSAVDNGTGEREPEVTYTAQLRSALPVREAYVRLKEIQAHFDTMAPDAKARAKQALDGYLTQKFDDKIVILVEYGSNLPELDRAMATYWQSRTLGTLKNTVFLTDQSGERVEPTAFVAGTGASREFQFVFPRNAAVQQSHPDAPMAFEFVAAPLVTAISPTGPTPSAPEPSPVPGGLQGGRMYFKFETKQMNVDGKVTY